MKERSITVLAEDSVGRKSGIAPFTLTVSPGSHPQPEILQCSVSHQHSHQSLGVAKTFSSRRD